MKRHLSSGGVLATVFASALALFASVAIASSAPTASTGAASQVGASGAQVAASVDPNGQSTTYAFQYGTTTNYGSQTATADAGSGTSTESVHATLNGLASGTTYHFRVVATNPSGTTAGSDTTFVTNPTPPTITTGNPSLVTGSSATLVGTVNPNGKATTYSFQYGPTTSYGLQSATSSAGAGSSSLTVHATLSGLTQGTTYHYRLVGLSSDGAAVGSDGTFTTSGNPPTSGGPLPVVSQAAAANATTSSVQLQGAVNPRGSRTIWYFQYGLNGYYGMQSQPQAMTGSGAQPVQATLNGLQSGTTYHFRLVAYSAHGLYVGLDHTFTTTSVTRARLQTLFLRTYVYHHRGIVNLVVNGWVSLPSTVPASKGCTGAVAVQIRRGYSTIGFHRAFLRPDCTYRLSAYVSYWRIAHSRLGIFGHFEGNQMLYPANTQRFVRIY
jgi:hypothetical protein